MQFQIEIQIEIQFQIEIQIEIQFQIQIKIDTKQYIELVHPVQSIQYSPSSTVHSTQLGGTSPMLGEGLKPQTSIYFVQVQA